MYRTVRGLLQTVLDMRAYRRLRAKVFLRSDQVDEGRIADFPDASKILSSSVELEWPRRELYALLWQLLAHGDFGETFRWAPAQWRPTLDHQRVLFVSRREIADEVIQREWFHDLAGPWMGKDRRRGFPYTWIPNHLGDTKGRVSPHSFLAALGMAAKDTQERHWDHAYALHYDSIKRGMQEASRRRVQEVLEDYPWIENVMRPLGGMVVPCRFEEVRERWEPDVLGGLNEQVKNEDVKLPPSRLDEGAAGVRENLETLGVFQRMRDGRVNIPDVFRVGYGLGRRGGVKPVR